MPVRKFNDPDSRATYYTVICDRCLRVGPTRLHRNAAFLDGGFLRDVDPWGAPVGHVHCKDNCLPIRLEGAQLHGGACPSCGYAYTRYDRILERLPYIPGEPCPECTHQADLLTLGDDARHVERVVRALADDSLDAMVESLQVPRTYSWSRLPNQLTPGTVWRGRQGRLFAQLQRCTGEFVDVVIDPQEPSGRRQVRLPKDHFLNVFECVAIPNDAVTGDDEPTLEFRHERRLRNP